MGESTGVKLSKRQLWLLIGHLEVGIKDMEESDQYAMGIIDPDRESELQELRDLLEKLYAALAELGRRV